MSLPVLLRTAAPRVGALMAASSEVVARVAMRIGSPGATAQRIVELAKNNKLVTFTILYELYGAADDLVQKFMKADSQLGGILETFTFGGDEPDMKAEHANDKLSDEFEVISAAVSQVGGFDRLLTLRKAFALSADTYALYRKRAVHGRMLAL